MITSRDRSCFERELAAATLYWKDDPAICEMKRAAGLKAELPERVDPPTRIV
jgi:hypothetical protein